MGCSRFVFLCLTNLKDHKFEICLDCQSSSNGEYILCWAHSFTRAGQKLMFEQYFVSQSSRMYRQRHVMFIHILKVQCQHTTYIGQGLDLHTVIEHDTP